MDDKSAGTVELGKSAFVNNFSISFGDIVPNTGTVSLKLRIDVDAVLLG